MNEMKGEKYISTAVDYSSLFTFNLCCIIMPPPHGGQQFFLYSEFKIILQKKVIESHESWEGGKYRHETTSVQHVWWKIDGCR